MHCELDGLTEEPVAGASVKAAAVFARFARPAPAAWPAAKPALSPAASCPGLPGTDTNSSGPSNGYPQGEKKRASRSNRSMSRAVNSLACSQARAESGSCLASSATASRLLRILNTSSICHLPRYRPRAWSTDSSAGDKEASTITYSANSNVSGWREAPRSSRRSFLARSAAAVLLRTACNHTSHRRCCSVSNCTAQVPGRCPCKVRISGNSSSLCPERSSNGKLAP